MPVTTAIRTSVETLRAEGDSGSEEGREAQLARIDRAAAQASGLYSSRKLTISNESLPPSGGVIFSTLQKFSPMAGEENFPMLSDRRNIIVIADEAHRSQQAFREVTRNQAHFFSW